MGRSHALLLAERGADVIVLDIIDRVDETAAMIRERGRRAHPLKVDVRDVPALQSGIQEAADGFGPIDILVNNAGVGGRRLLIDEISVEDFDRMFKVHVRGTFFATQAVVPGRTERKYGRIVNISSIYGHGRKAPGHPITRRPRPPSRASPSAGRASSRRTESR